MKSIFVTILFLTSTVFAQTAPETAPAVNAPADLNQAFQKEYVYLASQKQALLSIQKQTEQMLKAQSRELKGSATAIQAELVGVTSKNDEQHEYLLSLEKRKKELEKKGTSLENSYKKAQTMIAEMQAGLKFEIVKEKETGVAVPEELRVSTFEDIFNKTNSLIAAASKTETFDGSFLNGEDKLVEGSITRFGRSAAIGSVGGSHFVLAPNGSGLLKALAASENPRGAFAHLFIFDNLSKESKIKHTAGFTEKLADFSPLLFLGMILLLVAGLFSALIKV